MAYRKFEVYEYRQIIYRLQSGQSHREIARLGLAGRKKVKQIEYLAKSNDWLEAGAKLPSDEEIAKICQVKRPPTSEPKLKEYDDLIRPWIAEGIQASVIHQHLVEQYQFKGSYNCVQRYIKQIKDADPGNLTVPLNFTPGEAAQIDFGQGPLLLDLRTGKRCKTWFFVMTLCFSRHQYAELVTHQDIETWLKCHQNAFEWFGGVPHKLIIDNPKCGITKASITDPQLQRSYEEFVQQYGCIVSPCPPADPQKKGRVESGVKYVKKNFVPLRSFSSLQDANKQLKEWITGKAGNRTHGTTRNRPLDSFEEMERKSLKPLPVGTVEISIWKKVKLFRDCHIRINHCRYSAPFQYANQKLWAKVTPTMVNIYSEHILVASHARCFTPDIPKTKTEHLPPNAQAFFGQNEEWCIKEAEKIGVNCLFVIETLLTDPVKDLLRAAQAVVRLGRKYNTQRLENACARAIQYNAISADTIKRILHKGLDYQAVAELDGFDQLGNAYTGTGVYQRKFTRLKH